MDRTLGLFLVVAVSVLAACGYSEPVNTRGALIEWEEGNLDFFGCPYVLPEPWVSDDVHQVTCGAGCSPILVGGPRTFVACVSENMEIPLAGGDQTVLMTHPVTRESFRFSNLRWLSMTQVCWAVSSDQGVEASLPDECFERAVP